MHWTVLAVISTAVFLFVLERIFPDQNLPHVKGWWFRIIFLNLCQIGIVFLAGISWDIFLLKWSLLDLNYIQPWIGGFWSYILITFVFYWWHRLRHDSFFFWLAFHQLHHSPRRIEALTSFYKHPMEIIINSILISSISYTLLGLNTEGAAWAVLYAGTAELIYHTNIRTPRLLGYFFQRPEMHRIHHQTDLHYYNFSDLPFWDILFRTWRNPERQNESCGFKGEEELQFVPMLMFSDATKVIERRV